jgi:hypothetical protein
MKTKWTKRWQTWALATVLGAVATSCGSAKIPDPPAVTNRASLTAFGGSNACQDLEQYIEDNAVLQMRTQLEAQRDGVPSWGWWGGWGLGEGDVAYPGAATNGASGSTKSAPTSYTTTNNQVAGVDEADFVKNDGTRAFVLSGQKLYATHTWPATELAVKGSLDIEGWPQEMFLDGTDKVVVFSSIYRWYSLSNTAGVACNSLDCGYYNANTVKVTVVDVSDLTNLHVLNQYFVPGNYNSARRVGESVRLVISNDFNFPSGFKWSPDWSQDLWNDKAKLAAAYDGIIADNEKLIRAQTLADWVPAATSVSNGVTTVLPQACNTFSKVNAPTRLGTVSIVTLDLNDPGSLSRTSILAEPGEIYASASNLYVATRHWWWWPAPGQKDTTYVHKFDISQPAQATYVASGTVDGHIVDQFSMDENQAGFFRVATTIGTRVADQTNPDNWWGTLQLTNRLSVLSENAGYLDVIGATADFAAGESLMATRFVDDKAFAVTYQNTDPLFTFDLSQAAAPRKVGELQVPGFSTYLHPIDATHLLTVGEFVPAPVNGTTDWNARTLQLAIYDVSDLANPRQTFTQAVGTAYSWSEALYDHKAFNYFPERKLLAIPFSDWSWGGTTDENVYWENFVSELRVYSVDAATGFTPRGAVSMNDMYQAWHSENWTYYWTPSVRRSVMADDFVYAISDSGMRVANIANLAAPLATADFTRTLP